MKTAILFVLALAAGCGGSVDGGPSCTLVGTRFVNAAPNASCDVVSAGEDYDAWTCAEPYAGTSVPPIYHNCAPLPDGNYCCPSYE